LGILLLSAAAGICGTGAGGVLTVMLGRRSAGMLCGLLSFASGVMISVVCFGLIPEAIEISNMPTAISGLILGVVIIMPLNRLVDIAAEKRYRNSGLLLRKAFLRSGLIMMTAIGLHNIPEGVAIGAGGSRDVQFGILLAVMIALHDIPEGMAIAAPLMAGGISKAKTVLLTVLSGAPTLLGGMFGLWFGNISDAAIALSLSAAGGAMLYVVFGEIIPQSSETGKNRAAAVFALAGIIAGLMIAVR